MSRRLVVAVDGPAGSGKSAVAAALAEALCLAHVDTGAMYRALALKAIRAGLPPEDAGGLASLLSGTSIELSDNTVLLDGEDVTGRIRRRDVTSASSRVAEHEPVRSWMVRRQRAIVDSAPEGAVVEGRDIGTVVLPDADLKIFLTASQKRRAERRAAQTGSTLVQSMQEVSGRDTRDSGRRISPLRAAEDAVVVDTTEFSLAEVVERVLGLVAGRGR